MSAADEPTIAFVLNTQQWLSVLHPLTKLELLDWTMVVGANFFYDVENKAYVLLLKSSVWEGVSDPMKARFRVLSRRVREEMDGPFTDAQRTELDNLDPFTAFKKQDPPETIPEEEEEGESK